MNKKTIDVTFDFTLDSNGRDPDASSPTLKRYHQLLWSKKLPNGHMFDLNPEGHYLGHNSGLGEFYLTSDSIVHTYSKWKRTQELLSSINNEEIKSVLDLSHTIGGYIIYPGKKINGLSTFNQERGTNYQINDRFDLTLECIRRFYNQNQDSPLRNVINRYHNFFELFSTFKGYCEFFLLQDLVNEDFNQIRFFLPFNDFENNPLPRNINEYRRYLENIKLFIIRRNKRILSTLND